MTIWTGKRMASHFVIENGSVCENQIQPNGVDLTVDKIFVQTGSPTLANSDEYMDKGTLTEIKSESLNGLENSGWFLNPGAYVVEWTEVVSIPNTAVGMIFPRSTLLRMGHQLIGALWDRGYTGKGRSLLVVNRTPLLLEKGVRMCQMIFVSAKSDKSGYKGQYQGENIVKK